MTILILSLMVFIFLIWNYRLSAGTEEQPYRVVEKLGKIEIREYPPAVFASVTKPGEMMDAGSAGFRSLAGYIFGGNELEQQIPMTAPVLMKKDQKQDLQTEMSFVMPASMSLDKLPAPRSGEIRLWKSDTVYLAVLRFGGFVSNQDIREKADELRSILKAAGINFRDEVLYMGYNPPFQLINRRNEVAFRLDKTEN